MTKRITIIDADSVAYRSAAASETRSILVTHEPTGIQKSFDNRTAFKDLLKSKNKLGLISEYKIEDKQEPEPVENCLHTVKSQILKIEEATQADQLVIVVGGKSNYREKLPLPVQYKSQRADMLRPLHLKESKRYLIERFGAKEVNGIEADDEVIILAHEYRDEGFDVTIASIDKDNNQVEDFAVYNYADETMSYLEGHTLEKISKGKGSKIIGSGVGFLALQCTLGDKSDGYRPADLTGLKYGEMAAFNLLKNCKEPKEYLEAVKHQYQEWYPNDVTYTAWDGKTYVKNWREILQMFFQCAYMLRSRDDEANAKKFFAYYGVKL